VIHWNVNPLNKNLGQFAPAWDELLATMFSANPMLDSRFVNQLLKHFGDGTEQLCILYRGEKIDGMCVLRPGVAVWSTFLPSQAQIAPALIPGLAAIPELFLALPNRVVQLDFLANDPDFGDLSNRDNRKSESRDHAFTMAVDLTGGFETYWQSRSKNLRKNIARYERRILDEQKTARLNTVTDSKDLADAMKRYGALESVGWKGASGTAIEPQNAQGAFYLDLLTRFSNTSSDSSVYELWIDDRLAASRLVITRGKTLVILKTTFDEALARFAPGRLLLYHVLQSAFAQLPGGRIEFYTDANADQLTWSTHHRWIRHVSFYRKPWISQFLAIARAGRNSFASNSGASAKPVTPRAAEEIEVYKHPNELPPDVCKLFDLAEETGIESGISWYKNLVNSVYSHDKGVRIYVLRRHGTAIAVLPVLIGKAWGGKMAQSLANYYTSLYTPLLSPLTKAIDLASIIRQIMADNKPMGCFRFAPMDPKSITYRRLLNGLRTAGLVPFQFFSFGNCFLKVDDSWDDYLADREGTLRSTIKRMGKRFSTDGGTFEIVLGGDRLEACIEAYKEVYADSWKIPEPFPDFMPGLIRSYAEKGAIRLGVAWLANRPVAAQVWIVSNRKASIFKLAYRQSAKDYAPGTLLTAHLMQQALDVDRVAEVDYLIGDDPYKKTWMSDRRERWGIVAYAPRSLAGSLGLASELLGRLTKQMRVKFANRQQY